MYWAILVNEDTTPLKSKFLELPMTANFVHSPIKMQLNWTKYQKITSLSTVVLKIYSHRHSVYIYHYRTQIEYTLVKLDHETKKPKLSLLGPTLLEILQKPEVSDPENHHTKWRPEYASYMIEGMFTPGTHNPEFTSPCNAM